MSIGYGNRYGEGYKVLGYGRRIYGIGIWEKGIVIREG